MKKIFIVVIIVIFFVLSFIKIEAKNEKKNINNEIRAIYISYIELDDYVKDKVESESKTNIDKMLDDIKNAGFNTVILHVRPFADSIYVSEYFPFSSTVLNEKELPPNYDVFQYFIDGAHSRGLLLDAWINPFRISNLTDLETISKDSVYYKFVGEEDAKIIDGKGIYLNPASDEVQELIINGIEEIVSKYDVDGIHFDDYFYPDDTIDLKSFEEYKKSGGTLSLNDYRLNNITKLIKNVYSSIKKIKPDVSFGIAPEGNIENNYEKNFIDIKEILSKEGYVDYIMPQIYYGFENETKPFIETIGIWNELIVPDSIKLIPALAFYKVGRIDKYAGLGINEWVDNNDIIKKQVLISRNVSNYGGFCLFRYDYIFNKEKQNQNTSLEFDNLMNIV